MDESLVQESGDPGDAVQMHGEHDDDNAGIELPTALAYYQAWTGLDFDRAMSFIASDIVCDSPGGRLNGAAAFRDFMEPFTRMVSRTDLLAAFGDDHTALLMYNTDTVPVPDAPAAELHTISTGRITHLRIIFDRVPFAAARQVALAQPRRP